MSEIIDKPELEHEPTWDVAQLFPSQGDWSEAEYLAHRHQSSGRVLPGPCGVLANADTQPSAHRPLLVQGIGILCLRSGRLGRVVVAAYKVKLWEGKYPRARCHFRQSREPVRAWVNSSRCGADLVIEVVQRPGSPAPMKDRSNDKSTLRPEFQEYWIVDPQLRADHGAGCSKARLTWCTASLPGAPEASIKVT